MGSHDFQQDSPYSPDVTVEQVYRDLVSRARVEFGSDRYNGSISTTEGVDVPTDQVFTPEDAQEYIEERLDGLSKGGPCEAIRVARTEPIATRTVTKDFRIPAGVPAKVHAAQSLNLRSDERIVSAELAEHARATQVRDVTITASKGTSETRYFLINLNNSRPELPRWENGHASQAAARQRLTELLPKETTLNSHMWGTAAATQYEIVSMTRRVSGEALVTGAAVPAVVKGRYDIVIEKHEQGAAQTHWVFYGWVAS